MTVDIVLFILIGLLYLAMATMGGFVASERQGYRDAFLIMGIVGAFLILVQAFRITEAQQQANSPFIQDVEVSFVINISLDNSAIVDYRNRLEKGIQHYLSSPQKELHIYVSSKQDGSPALCLENNSPLLPNRETEVLSWAVLTFVGLTIELYKTPISIQEYIDQTIQPDFKFFVTGSIDKSYSFFTVKSRYTAITLCYDVNEKQFFVRASKLLSDPLLWENNGKITKIFALSEVQMIIRFDSRFFLTDGPNLQKNMDDISSQFKIESVNLRMSGGHEFKFADDNLKPYKDKKGLSFYVTTFPKQ